MSERIPTEAEPGPLGRMLVERLASGRLPAFLRRFVYLRLDKDPALARYYDSLRRLERAAAGHPSLSADQKQLLHTLLFEDAPPSLAAPARASSWPRAAVALAGAAAAALLFVQIEGPAPQPDEVEWIARSAREASFGVRARCLSSNGRALLAEAEAGVGPRVSAPELSCPSGGLLALSATNRGDRDLYVFVVGIADDGGLRWLAPFDHDASSVRVQRGGVDVVLGDLAALRASRDDERVALHALFSTAPLSAREVEGALALARRQGLLLEKLPRVPLDVSAQTRLDLVLRRAEDR